MTQETLFNVEELARAAVATTPWHGAPLSYTTTYWTPAELDAAMDRYRDQYGNFGCLPRSHMWNRSLCNPPLILPDHELHLFHADTRCKQPDHNHTSNPLPTGLSEQVNCPNCRWHQIGSGSQVEAWHDHAMPGWRDLPVLPDKLRERSDSGPRHAEQRLAWIQDNYPAHWQFPGAPILTRRNPQGTRAVPGRSPLGGYDITADQHPR